MAVFYGWSDGITGLIRKVDYKGLDKGFHQGTAGYQLRAYRRIRDL